MLENEGLHEKILYPVTRVRAGSAGGSGVVVYSEPDPKKPDEYINIAITCQHVVDGAIKMRDEFDSVLTRNRKTDYFAEVIVEIFQYLGSRLISSNATSGDIIAYDKHHDLAAIRLHNPNKMPYVASIIPEDEIKDVRLFDNVVTSGCSLLHDPFGNMGTITSLREVIEQKNYIMANAPAIFGNSGGGLFHGDTGHLLGLTSRVTVTQMGFGLDVQAWMNFSTHPERLYEFFDNQELHFIVDDSDDYYTAMTRREGRKKDAIRDFFINNETEEQQDVLE